MTIALIATVTPKPEAVDKVEALMRELTGHSRAEPGARRYDLFRGTDATVRFHVFEIYADEAAVEAHRTSPHYTAFRAAVGDLLAEAPVVVSATPVDTVE
ncbi:putative quinol monooxygenase [Nitrospirillum sp. BR 11163]|uniref:putative quinol monooxygenase n=1 Tax=Nitrospirillum sp. BR 11163 TaxID=3104323 RepID=UPI002AFFB35E|nr:putative quinol monooxygenase [Nitrospirillum sp. BR 11163]MEA1673673.1 putative quinol monooxygenase [Nitrospirillum sp. BR 11163]